MKLFSIPKKEKCLSNGYTAKYSKGMIDEFCDNPLKFKIDMYVEAIINIRKIFHVFGYNM